MTELASGRAAHAVDQRAAANDQRRLPLCIGVEAAGAGKRQAGDNRTAKQTIPPHDHSPASAGGRMATGACRAIRRPPYGRWKVPSRLCAGMPPALPVLDVSALNGAVRQRRALARDIRTACEATGFFYAANHGIPQPLIDSVLAQSRAFFALPLAERLAIDKKLSPCNRGYEPMRAQILEAGAPPDLKAGFYIGADIALDDPRVRAGQFNVGPNQWPSGLSAFRGVMEEYFLAATALSVRLMRGLALSLDLDEDYFADFLPRCRRAAAAAALSAATGQTRSRTRRAAARTAISAA